jgi:hypothetical protein
MRGLQRLRALGRASPPLQHWRRTWRLRERPDPVTTANLPPCSWRSACCAAPERREVPSSIRSPTASELDSIWRGKRSVELAGATKVPHRAATQGCRSQVNASTSSVGNSPLLPPP